MPIKIIAIGKRHEPWLDEGIRRYEKRLHTPFHCEWVLIPASRQKGSRAAHEESESIIHKLSNTDFSILLDERGKMFDSPALSQLIAVPLERSQTVTIIVGGAYGVDEELRARVNRIWSFSPLVFPHQLVRLLLIEQLYRAQMIYKGLPYHNE